jgi:hypothetical protein
LDYLSDGNLGGGQMLPAARTIKLEFTHSFFLSLNPKPMFMQRSNLLRPWGIGRPKIGQVEYAARCRSEWIFPSTDFLPEVPYFCPNFWSTEMRGRHFQLSSGVLPR